MALSMGTRQTPSLQIIEPVAHSASRVLSGATPAKLEVMELLLKLQLIQQERLRVEAAVSAAVNEVAAKHSQLSPRFAKEEPQEYTMETEEECSSLLRVPSQGSIDEDNFEIHEDFLLRPATKATSDCAWEDIINEVTSDDLVTLAVPGCISPLPGCVTPMYTDFPYISLEACKIAVEETPCQPLEGSNKIKRSREVMEAEGDPTCSPFVPKRLCLTPTGTHFGGYGDVVIEQAVPVKEEVELDCDLLLPCQEGPSKHEPATDHAGLPAQLHLMLDGEEDFSTPQAESLHMPELVRCSSESQSSGGEDSGECTPTSAAALASQHSFSSKKKRGSSRGSQRESPSWVARARREKISRHLRTLHDLVPGCGRLDTASMLDQAISYVTSLQSQIKSS